MEVKVKRMGQHNLPLPKYETKGASGFDLRAVVAFRQANQQGVDCWHDNGDAYLLLNPGARVTLRVGFAFEVPAGYEIQVRPRSGLSKRGIVGTFGTVDSDYRGEVCVILTNQSGEPFRINHGDRVAQGVVCPVWQADLVEAEELTPTERGEGGFGSTGTA